MESNKLAIKRIEEDLAALYSICGNREQGVTRLPYTEADRLGRAYLVSAMEQAGLTVHVDGVGSVVGRLEGADPTLPALLLGSHYDTVIDGGKLDGTYGIAAAIEIVRVLTQNNIKLAHPLEIIAFNDEEGIRFGGGFLGSLALTGGLSHDMLFSMKDKDGLSLAHEMAAQGFEPTKIKTALRKPQDLLAYIELHIEQGPVLDAQHCDIGIVTSIVGMQRYHFTITGRPDHAGTTPMGMRHDPLVAAAKIVTEVEKVATMFDPDGVATVGCLRVEPCAINIVPHTACFTLDIRSKDECAIHRVVEHIIALTEELCGDKLKFSFVKTVGVKPAHMAQNIQENFESHILARSLRYRHLISGAGHDALIMSDFVPTAMLFVPSKNGRSHCKEEFTESSHLLMGAEILFETVKDLCKVVHSS